MPTEGKSSSCCACMCSEESVSRILEKVLYRDVLRVAVGKRPPDRYRERIARQLGHSQGDGVPDALVYRDEGRRTHSKLERPCADDPRLLEPRQFLRTYSNLETLLCSSFGLPLVFRSCDCYQKITQKKESPLGRRYKCCASPKSASVAGLWRQAKDSRSKGDSLAMA